MDRINQSSFYELGKTLHALETRDKDVPAVEVIFEVNSAMMALNGIIGGQPFPLGVSRAAATSLRNSIQAMWNQYFTKPDDNGVLQISFPDKDQVIYAWQWIGIKENLSKFENVFAAEMNEAATYFVPTRGIYSTAALIDYADQSFPANIYGHVPDRAKADWKAAGRCLAFTLLSAAGFHAARAVEATLEVYYQLYTGKSGTLHGWNDYIVALEKARGKGISPAPADKTLAELKQMKDDYRNPLVHPRVTLTESDARMLFNNGESLIIAMAEEIGAIRNKGGVQGALAVVAQAALPSPDSANG